MGITEKVAITVAVIGLTGTLGAALINSGALKRATPAGAVQNQADDPPPDNTAAAAEDRTRFAPHAPEIEVGAQMQTWGEQIKTLTLEPSKNAELRAQELYTHATTFPELSCAGPGQVIYSWQVRQPYPEGGDLEIRATVPRSGGNTVQVAMGARGRGEMGGCDEHFFFNRGLQPMIVEVRYVSAISDEASTAYYQQQSEPAADETVRQ